MIPSLTIIVAAMAIAGGLANSGCSRSKTVGRKVIVLGIDGMDPGFVERHWDALPNLDRLRHSGEFKRLATTTPPQSPVAWSTFATGMDPDHHGIYDFVHRNPSTMQPFSSLAEAEDPRHTVRLGPWLLPLDKGTVHSLRQGRTFWEILGDANVPVDVVRMPANYPAAKFKGTALSGMGVPDLRGTFGTFTLYTDNPYEASRDVPGGHISHTNLSANHAVLLINGPVNSLRKDRIVTTVPMTVDVDPVEPAARFTVLNEQFILRQGEWSDWIQVRFPLIPGIAHANGIFRVYAGELRPGFRVYVSPVNVNPTEPDLPISWPERYSHELAASFGPFYTQGIREDTSALRANALTLPEYLQQSRHILGEDLALLRYKLSRFRDGLLFFYFSSIDQDSHVLWGAHDRELLDTYRAVDAAIGEVMRAAPEATLIVMSDHGFTSFTRAFNLNTWLMEHGYLTLDDRRATGSDHLFRHVDWGRTKAYSLGLNALYLNLAGREKRGIVAPGPSARQILSDLSDGLFAVRDPVGGASVFTEIRKSSESGTRSQFAPDLIAGYSPGYRASWGAALGAVEPSALQDNLDAWIGDHCVAAGAVPGVLFANRRSEVDDPAIKDLTVTLLRLFGVDRPAQMSGRALY